MPARVTANTEVICSSREIAGDGGEIIYIKLIVLQDKDCSWASNRATTLQIIRERDLIPHLSTVLHSQIRSANNPLPRYEIRFVGIYFFFSTLALPAASTLTAKLSR